MQYPSKLNTMCYFETLDDIVMNEKTSFCIILNKWLWARETVEMFHL